jgi:hypothetical protein
MPKLFGNWNLIIGYYLGFEIWDLKLRSLCGTSSLS